MGNELPPEKLYRRCDPDLMDSIHHASDSPLKTIIGQERAVRALRFGLGIKEKGFNIYVSGRPGTGRITAIERFLEETAAKEQVPSDWCYVNNFRENYHPRILELPAGHAVQFQDDMGTFINSVAREIRNAFEGEDYAAHREEIENHAQDQKRALLDDLNQKAHELNFMLQASPMGLMTIPIRNGKPLTEEEFINLKPEEKESITKTQQNVETMIETVMRQVKGLDKEVEESLQKLDREVALYAIKHLISDIQEKYQGMGAIQTYLEQVQSDILSNLPEFKPEADGQPSIQLPFMRGKQDQLRKYSVNVLVDNSELKGAPVVIERNPTYSNLFGKIEQEANFGALTTDFTLIRPGSLHKANGGYLVLPVEELITSPLCWDSLKHALQNREIVVEDAMDKLGVMSTKSLKPEAIPLNVKVVLVGRPDIFQLLLGYDEHFNELFKVKADFDTQMEWSEEHVRDYAGFITKLCEEENLTCLDTDAMARIVEHGSRLAEDQQKLSTHFGEISDVIREASYYASTDGAPLATAEHVRKAINERFYRSALIHERIQEMILRDEIKIDVDGKQPGQVNGLSVIELGDIEFGQPNRITVSIGLGRDGLIDIEREAKLGGPIHTKGVMILSGYLTEKYAQNKPLSLSARLVFEQNYSGVEGDSASSTELYAILSALSGLPVLQGIAVTGSVNQKGEVQAIGGVNEKIEGFFAICEAKGLTGQQGVIIPQSNVDNLMLKESVVEAVRNGQFHIWPVQCIDEGIEILTGVSAGKPLDSGGYENNTVHHLVDQRLMDLAERMESFGDRDGSADK